MKTVFHGTTLDRANSIIESGTIEITNNRNKREKDTRIGYVYVTSILQNALDFSVRPSISEDTASFVVFKFNIRESELIIDEDEQKWNSCLLKSEEPSCFIIPRDIDIVKDHVKWYKKENNYSGQHIDFIDYLNRMVENIKESEWNRCQD